MNWLISDGYLEQQKLLHADGKYGQRGDKWAPSVIYLYQLINAQSILDYGCGAGSLAKELSNYYIDVMEYDPAIEGKDFIMKSADLVVCTDVLEHIEPDRLSDVLYHLHLLTRKMLFAVVATEPAGKHLADGRNAHLIIEDEHWWRVAIDRYFAVKKTWRGAGMRGKWVVFLRPR